MARDDDRESMSERLSSPLTAEHLERRRREGWREVAVTWERDPAAAPAARRTEVPYGLRAAAGGRHLEEDPDEMAVLRRMLAGVIRDRPLSAIAADLGSRDLRRRDGGAWTETELFELLPRVVDEAPAIYASAEWRRLRRARAS